MLMLRCFIFIPLPFSEPVADCTNELIFNRTRYSDNEQGFRYLDGKIDCYASSSSGHAYYVQDYDVRQDEDAVIVTCHPLDGACFKLKSTSYLYGWKYEMKNISGNFNIIIICLRLYSTSLMSFLIIHCSATDKVLVNSAYR